MESKAKIVNLSAVKKVEFWKRVEALSWVFAILASVVWSSWPALSAMTATVALKPISKHTVVNVSQSIRLDVQRNIQKHYLDFGIYLPLEDIVFTEQVMQANPDLDAMLKKVCGASPIAIWIPLQFRLPFIGERSVEWCWKPSLNG